MLNSAAHKMKKKRNKCKLSAKLDAKELKFGQILILKPTLQISVMRVGSDTFGDPIFQKGLQN